MKKLFFLCAVALCCTSLWAVQAPTNLRWDGNTCKWDLPEGEDIRSVFLGVYVKKGENVFQFGAVGGDASLNQFAVDVRDMLPGFTYYFSVRIKNVSDEESEHVFSADTVIPGEFAVKPIEEISVEKGVVTWKSAYSTLTASSSYPYNLLLEHYNTSTLAWEEVASATQKVNWSVSYPTYDFSTYLAGGQKYRYTISHTLFGIKTAEGSIEVTTPDYVTITFDGNGKTAPSPISIERDSQIDDIQYVVDGYIAKWYIDAAGTTSWDFKNTAFTQDTTLYAQWIEYKPLNVRWDGMVGKWDRGDYEVKNIFVTLYAIRDEGPVYVTGSSFSGISNQYDFSGMIIPGQTYYYKVHFGTSASVYSADVESEQKTFEGEFTPINMEVTISDGIVRWSPTSYKSTEKAQLELFVYEEGEWKSVATGEAANWATNSFSNFSSYLQSGDDKTYKVEVKKYQVGILTASGYAIQGEVPTALNVVKDEVKVKKVLRNGQIFIERDGVLYTLQGVSVN